MDTLTPRLTVLHYVGYDKDAGGVLSAVRALASADRFDCVLGVNPGFRATRQPELPQQVFPKIEGERLGLKTFWRARAVARELEAWLGASANRRLHLHSRAALAAGWWLAPASLERTVISVHCLGKQKWFYRASARRFGRRLFWLHPAMRAYYGLDTAAADNWDQCMPSAMTPLAKSAMAGEQRAARSPTANGRLVVGGIGAIVPWKRWDLVLDAIDTLDADTRAKVSFRHLGASDGTARSRHYEARLRQHAQSGSAQWKGAQPSSEAFLREIDCLVVASDQEPLSLAMLEALRAGVPVLRADSGGGLDAIWPNQNGWLFRAGDATDLAAHLWRLTHTDALEHTWYVPEAFERYLALKVAGDWLQIYRPT